MTILAIATAALSAVLLALGPAQIVRLELAGSAHRAEEILGEYLARYGNGAEWMVRRQLLVDFVFIPAYALLASLACVHAARLFGGAGLAWGAVLGLGLAWGQWAAGALDVAENLFLLRLLDSGIKSEACACVACCAALAKFALLIPGLLFGAAAFAFVGTSDGHRLCLRCFAALFFLFAVFLTLSVVDGLRCASDKPARAGSSLCARGSAVRIATFPKRGYPVLVVTAGKGSRAAGGFNVPDRTIPPAVGGLMASWWQ